MIRSELKQLLAFPAAHAQAGYQTPPEGVRFLFEAGLPDPELFPIDDLVRLSEKVLREESAEALQYGGARDDGIAAGYIGLRDVLAERTRVATDRAVDRQGVMVTCGAAQALALMFEAFVDPGDAVAIEAPTWNSALAMCARHGAETIALPIDDDGANLDGLEQHLERLASAGRRLKLVYTIATFNTPTGVCLSLDRRRHLIELARRWGFLIIEDNVYEPLRYDGVAIPTMFSLDDTGLVVKIDSFSKVVAPGLRLGWVTAEPDVIRALSSVRGDLGVGQWVARTMTHYLAEGLLEPHVVALNARYRAKREVAERALHEHCDPWVRWRTPEGGFFLWVGIDDAIDAGHVMQRALTEGVLCRAGERFFGDRDSGRQYLRLAFPSMPFDDLEEGIAILGTAIHSSRH
ncbi:MAG TPA: PLP-dependent aminotransferase family protein [Acidimicrobiales bacterium]|nr:PLP-dependent aminotransferase family protein [Acidimicrobiales bacterium]